MRQGSLRERIRGQHTELPTHKGYPFRELDWSLEDTLAETVEGFGRVYHYEGYRFPSITTCLGKSKSSEGLQNWIDRVGEEYAESHKRQRGRFGSKLHDALELYMRGVTPTNLTPDVLSAFMKIAKVLAVSVEEIWAVERVLISPSLKAAGRVDLVAYVKGLGPCIIDFKSAATPKEEEWIHSYFKQGAFYGKAWHEITGEKIKWVVIIAAADGLPEAQVFVKSIDKWLPQTKEAIDYCWEIAPEGLLKAP